MKILVIIATMRRGGAERVVSVLTKEWADSHELILILFDSNGISYDFGGKLVDLRSHANENFAIKFFSFLFRIFKLLKIFIREKPDKIFSFMESANIPSTIAAFLTLNLGRLMVSVHNDPSRFPIFYRIFIKYFYNLPFRVVGVSRGVTEQLRVLGCPPKKLITINNPLPSDRPFRSEKFVHPCANLINTKYILAVGRMHKQKGFDLLLKAFANVSDSLLHLVILGEGDERARLISIANELNISNRILLPGAVENIWPWYQHAHIFVLSSRYEGWGNVLVEAMSQGCPVVSFDCNYGPSEILKNGYYGILVENDSISHLSNALNELNGNRSKRDMFIQRGVIRSIDFKPNIIAQQWLDA